MTDELLTKLDQVIWVLTFIAIIDLSMLILCVFSMFTIEKEAK